MKRKKREKLYNMLCNKIPNRAMYWKTRLDESNDLERRNQILRHMNRLVRLQLNVQQELYK